MDSPIEISKESIDGGIDTDQLRKEAIEYRNKLARRGVIYMSRVPPFMKPNKAKTIFEQYGEVTRLFLAEEDPQTRKKRKDHGGNGSKQFREGWIEFADKTIAKQVAESLNNTPMGGKKSDYYHDDIWNLKYLKNFKWEFLTEKLTYERRIRETKMKTALLQAKKVNSEMAQLIEQNKVHELVRDRKDKKRTIENTKSEAIQQDSTINRIKRFKQHKLIGTNYDDNDNKVDGNVLHSIFSSRSK